MRTSRRVIFAFLLGGLLALQGCTHPPPMPTVKHVDLQRFMGDWYVIAHIPTFIEDEAYNAIESYALTDEGHVATTFTFREGGFDGERESWHPTGFVQPGTGNAVWDMQFVWPFRAEYRIVYLDDAYTQTVIGRSARDYVWIMTRDPHVDADTYRKLVDVVTNLGYDVSKLRKVPHQ
ncbi:MAG TPA: lipocalin family protein [Gammaproteobacteria bacterium]